MKKTRHAARAVGTIAVWLLTAYIIVEQLIVFSFLDLLLGAMTLFHATLSTLAIWWAPRYFRVCSVRVFPSQPSVTASAAFSRSGLAMGWKLAFVAAVSSFATLPIWVTLHFGYFPNSFSLPLVVPLLAILALPVVYLLAFSLWHWRTRYAGKHHLAWPILFVVTAWPLFSTLPGSAFTSLAYFILHILPDARGKGIYANPKPLSTAFPASSLPQSYQLAQSACFVAGWTLVIGGVLFAAITCFASFAIWNIFEDALPRHVGEEISESIAAALWTVSQLAKINGLTSLLSAIAAALGASLVYASQRLRWRLLEEQEKEELRKSI